MEGKVVRFKRDAQFATEVFMGGGRELRWIESQAVVDPETVVKYGYDAPGFDFNAHKVAYEVYEKLVAAPFVWKEAA